MQSDHPAIRAAAGRRHRQRDDAGFAQAADEFVRELGLDAPHGLRVAAAFTELAAAI